jgi:hypothetical protein
VPIVEPEVTLGEGDYSIERTAFISEKVNSQVRACARRQPVRWDEDITRVVLPSPGDAVAERVRRDPRCHPAQAQHDPARARCPN